MTLASLAEFFNGLDSEKLTVIGILFSLIVAFATGQLAPGFMLKASEADKQRWIEKYLELSEANAELGQLALKILSGKRRRNDSS